jgi:hypothetical protein
MQRHERNVGRDFVSDVLRKLQMYGAQPLLLREPKRFAYDRGDGRRADDLPRHLGQRRHGRDDVDDLEERLLVAQDPFLAGDHNHRHSAEQGKGRTGGQVQRAWTQGREADARLAGQPPMGRRHERCGLLVPSHDQLDLGAAQRFDYVEVFFARNAEDLLDTLILKGGDEQVGAFHGLQSSLGAQSRLPTIRGPIGPERPGRSRDMTCAASDNRAGAVGVALSDAGRQLFDGGRLG